MPRCSDCRCDLPSFETLCSKCFEARYSAVGRPKSFLESVRQYVSNPFGITPDQVPSMRLPAVLFCCCFGLLVCWFGGFAEVGYKYSLFSDVVLSGAFLVLVKSAVLSLGLSLYLARKNGNVLGNRFGWVRGDLYLLRALVLACRRFSAMAQSLIPRQNSRQMATVLIRIERGFPDHVF